MIKETKFLFNSATTNEYDSKTTSKNDGIFYHRNQQNCKFDNITSTTAEYHTLNGRMFDIINNIIILAALLLQFMDFAHF